MFCHKCGTKVADNSSFCHGCGAKVVRDDIVQQAASSMPVQQTQSQAQDVPSDLPKKKKSKKLPIILGAVVLVIVAVIVIAMNWNGKIDYAATVRAHQPFIIQETSLTYGEVLEKYISSPVWEVRKSGDVNYVDISGKAKGTDNELVVTIKVTADPSDPDLAKIAPESVTIDGEKSPKQNDAVEFLLAMFRAYDEGYDDLSDLFSETGIPSGTQSTVGKTQSYDNEHGNIEVTLDYVEFVDKLEDTRTGDDIYPDEGCVFLRAAVTAENIGTEKGGLITGWNKIVYDDQYEFVEYFHPTEDDLTNIKPLSPPKKGALIFTVSDSVVESDKSLVLNINDVSGKPLISYVLRPAGGTIITANTSGERGTKSTADGKILYEGQPIAQLLGKVPEELFGILGDPTSGTSVDGTKYDGGVYFGYQGISLIMDDRTEMITWISGAPKFMEVNGVTLDKNRAGIISALGTPTREEEIPEDEYFDGRYIMEYVIEEDGIIVTVEMPDADSIAAKIMIAPFGDLMSEEEYEAFAGSEIGNQPSGNQQGGDQQTAGVYTLEDTSRKNSSSGNVYAAPLEFVTSSAVGNVNILNPEKVRYGCKIQIITGKNALGMYESYTIDEDGTPGGTAFTVVDATVID